MNGTTGADGFVLLNANFGNKPISMDSNSMITLAYNNTLPDAIFEEFISQSEKAGIKVQVKKWEPTVWASMEWAIPTFIAAYLLKPYFETLLQEAAKEHYPTIKKQCKKLAGQVHDMTVRFVQSGNSARKHSRVFSLCSTTRENIKLKFLFDESHSRNQWESATEQAVEILRQHHLKEKEDKLNYEITKSSKKTPHTVYLCYNSQDNRWEYFDEMLYIRESREKKDN